MNGYEISAGLYDHVGLYRERLDDVRYYVAQAAAAGGPVLELGCGTGRVMLPCARAGARITGLDRSAPMLAVARAKLEREDAGVRGRAQLVEGDMRSFDLGERFALVTIPFRGFQHVLAVEDQIACLENVHRHLEPGGLVALDVFNPMLQALVDRSRLAEWGDEPEFTTPERARVVRRFRVERVDLPRQVQYLEMIYYVTEPDGRSRRLVEQFSMRHFFRYEVEHLLARCGFTDIRIDGDFAGTPFDAAGDPAEIVALARRR
ncbi:MAG TPA: class I SAM-dependent methyltransferase [Vicinamibacterales bacterium]|nr:class I SAM-dependent methyltransferase [Acidobacteriota bacterium]HOC18688.1 class I SAM-dependent methyltransferase [Vicinamibacterales bacterium]